MLTFVVKEKGLSDITPLAQKLLTACAKRAGYDGPLQVIEEGSEEPTGTVIGLGTKHGTMVPSIGKLLNSGSGVTELTWGIRTAFNPPTLPKLAAYVEEEDMEAAWEWLSAQPDKLVALDIETGGDISEGPWAKDPVISIALYAGGDEALVIPREVCETPEVGVFLVKLCADFDVTLHNSPFDMPLLRQRCFAEGAYNKHDSMVMHHCLLNTANVRGLKELAQLYLGAPEWDADLAKKHLERVDRDTLHKYNAYDVYWTYHLTKLFLRMLEEAPRKRGYYQYRMRIAHMLHDLQVYGTPYDPQEVELQRQEQLSAAQPYEEQIQAIALEKVPEVVDKETGKFNPASPTQLVKLFKAFGAELRGLLAKKPTAESTNEEALVKLRRNTKDSELLELIDLVLNYRKWVKLAQYSTTFLEWGVDGVLHPQYKLFTDTGRLSASNPAIQTMPREGTLKKALTAPEGYSIITCDYSQAELRTVAELAGDDAMIAAFQPGAADFFDTLAVAVWPDRFPDIAAVNAFHKQEPGEYTDNRAKIKSVVYGLNYGRGIAAIAESLRIPLHEAQHIVDQYYRAYPSFAVWQRRVRESAGVPTMMWVTTTPFGLDYRQEIVTSRNRNKIENSSLAFTPQSAANDVCLHAALELHPRVQEYGARIVGLVHDAIYVMCPNEQVETVSRIMEREMSGAAERVFHRVPFVAEASVSNSWKE